jgi:hypothetical protein
LCAMGLSKCSTRSMGVRSCRGDRVGAAEGLAVVSLLLHLTRTDGPIIR